MRRTIYGWFLIRRPEFRRDLLAVIGAATPQEISNLALSHAQAVARTFTTITLCRRWRRPVQINTPDVEAFLHRGNNLRMVDSIWQRTLCP